MFTSYVKLAEHITGKRPWVPFGINIGQSIYCRYTRIGNSVHYNWFANLPLDEQFPLQQSSISTLNSNF
jgi:hypothetical protein